MKNTAKAFSRIFLVGMFLYLFLLGIGLLGAAFKGFGKGFAEELIRTTTNPFIGLFVGILATTMVQSSSTTTSIVVGMVASRVLTIGNAIPIVMGANIGTTVTNTLVALGQVNRKEDFRRAMSGATVHDFFNLIWVSIMFPLELSTGFLERTATWMSILFRDVGGIKIVSPIKLATKPAVHFVRDTLLSLIESSFASYIFMLILSFVMMYLALYFIVKIMKSLVASRAEIALNNVIGKNPFWAIIAGAVFTVMVVSSSITTSVMIPLVAAGILTVEAMFPLTLGANIGTTATAILASFATGDISAIVVAFVHFLFNVIGVSVIYPIKPLRAIPIRLAHSLGDLAAKKKRYALFYVIGLFYFVPALLIFIAKYFK